ncbi:hypothetical protein GC173_15645 [bacterium]|nr:hypothetical protein [bacterium]
MGRHHGYAGTIRALYEMDHPLTGWGLQRPVKLANGLSLDASWLTKSLPELAEDSVPPFAAYNIERRRRDWRIRVGMEGAGWNRRLPVPLLMFVQNDPQSMTDQMVLPLTPREIMFAIVAERLASYPHGYDKRYWLPVYVVPALVLPMLSAELGIYCGLIWVTVVANADLVSEWGRGSRVARVIAPLMADQEARPSFVAWMIKRRGLLKSIGLCARRIIREVAGQIPFVLGVMVLTGIWLVFNIVFVALLSMSIPPLVLLLAPALLFVAARSPASNLTSRFVRFRLEGMLREGERTIRARRRLCQSRLEIGVKMNVFNIRGVAHRVQ